MSNTRNGLLAQIVQAAGGTVTDASNRNSLLQDWLNAVSGPVGRWYFTGNGVDQFIRVDAAIGTGEVFSIDVSVANLSGARFLFDGELPRTFCYLDEQNRVFFNNVSLSIDGAPATSGVTVALGDNLKFEFTANVTFTLENLLARFNDVSFLAARVANLKVGDGSVYSFPFDDSFANNPTARNTGSGANGTYINATEASWTYE